MLFPVMQYETKYGADYRIDANEQNIRSGSRFIGYLDASGKKQAILKLKKVLSDTIEAMLVK